MEVSNELVVVVIDEGTSKVVEEVDNWREVPNSSVPLQDDVIILVTVGIVCVPYEESKEEVTDAESKKNGSNSV